MPRTLSTAVFFLLISQAVEQELRYKRCTPDQICLVFGSLMVSGDTSLYSANNLMPAIEMAIAKVNSDYLNPIGAAAEVAHYIYGPINNCVPTGSSSGYASSLFYRDSVLAFIGAPCFDALEDVALLANFWNVPIVSAAGNLARFSNDDQYATMTRFDYCECQFPYVVQTLFEEFGWVHVAIYSDQNDYISASMGESIASGLQDLQVEDVAYEIDIFEFPFNSNQSTTADYAELLRDGSANARMTGDVLRQIMLTAHDLNMTNGDWVFIDIELFKTDLAWGDKSWFRNDSRDADAKQAYGSLLRVSLNNTGQNDEFVRELQQTALSIYNYRFSWPDNQPVNYFIETFYDSTVALGQVFAEFLKSNRNITDGRAITDYLRNRTYNGASGQFFIDSLGERQTDYTIMDMDPADGEFKPVAQIILSAHLYEPFPGRAISWPGNAGNAGPGMPPTDVPACGYQNEKTSCVLSSVFLKILVPLFSVLLFVTVCSIIAVLGYRKWKREHDMKSLSWRIRWLDLVFKESLHPSQRSESVSPHSVSHSTASLYSNNSIPGFLTATYKGTKVAVKPFLPTTIQLDRKFLLQMNTVARLIHENVLTTIGACVDPPNVALITEFCSRGTLQQLLHESPLELDSVFKISILTDIAKGMKYLQNTDLKCHGNLCTEVCLVDSRFAIKISDWNMTGFQAPLLGEAETQNRLLYRAPEVLRSQHATSPKADVYSYGIIVGEVLDRAEPYENERLTFSVNEILEKIKFGSLPPMRPKLQHSTDYPAGLVLLSKQCLMEEDQHRPSFVRIVKILLDVNQGQDVNILDSLMARMEQYTKNLENVVKDRTAEVETQKHKLETLLIELLPRPVATDLLEGRAVQPQFYESCSVYFSDIVGFTTLSSESSPMEIVTMLNDLYTCLDGILAKFDCYKVETIGDAYMVVSGVPEQNGNLHAKEIALWALAARRAMTTFEIRHRTSDRLRLRMGIHSGSVVAGVVGLKMPRYCLFGDTVNTASRMESTGKPEKIQITAATQTLLEQFSGFTVKARGMQEIKGKGFMFTYWVVAHEDDETRETVPAIKSTSKRSSVSTTGN